jgi:hypothetical protein
MMILTDFKFSMFLDLIKTGKIYVDFDARTHHNHGTKFRIKQQAFPLLYKNRQEL